MPDGRHHDPHIEGKLIRAGLSEEVALKEHAGPFAELNNRAGHAFRPEGEVRRSVEGYGIEVRDMADFVRALGAGVLTGHDIAAQVDGYGVGAVHATFLAQGLDRPLTLDGGVKFVDTLAKTWFYGTGENKVLDLIQFGVEYLLEITAAGVDRQISRLRSLHRLVPKIPKFFLGQRQAACFAALAAARLYPPPCGGGVKHHSIMNLPPAPCKHLLVQSPDAALSQLHRCLPL
jgi:hypothetical protein